MNKRGVVLIICYMVIMVLSILGAAFFMRSISETSVTSKYFDSTQALWLAEAGASQALLAMEASFWVPVAIPLTPFGPGEYSVEVRPTPGTVWAHGYIPSQASCRAERIIELFMPFYSGVLYVVGDIEISGTSYSIDGNVIYAGTADPPIIPPPDNITGTVTYDPTITKLEDLKFDELRVIAQAQGNYYLTQPSTLPASFWFDEPNKVPNVVFLEGGLTLKGNDVVNGFFVVGGEAVYDTTIAGNVTVNGCIYTQGDFTVLGGGGTMNVTGGIWVGGSATLKGGITLQYDADFLKAAQDLGMSTTKPKILWSEAGNPF